MICKIFSVSFQHSGQNAHFLTHKKSAKMAPKSFFMSYMLKKLNLCAKIEKNQYKMWILS